MLWITVGWGSKAFRGSKEQGGKGVITWKGSLMTAGNPYASMLNDRGLQKEF
jgi:hypothetical protein